MKTKFNWSTYYPILCRFTGEVIKEFPFPTLRDEYIHVHKLAGCVYSPLNLRLSYTEYENLEIDFYIALAKEVK